jgi:hypothetical protein
MPKKIIVSRKDALISNYPQTAKGGKKAAKGRDQDGDSSDGFSSDDLQSDYEDQLE